MKSSVLASFLWLMAATLAVAQSFNGLPPPAEGMGPTANAAHAVPPRPTTPLLPPGSTTANSPNPGPLPAPGSASLMPGAAQPGAGNTSGVGVVGGTSAVPVPVIPPVVTMPISMALIDNTRKLVASDEVQYQVVQDRSPPTPLFVDEKGTINVPLLGPRPAANLTLKEVAEAIKKELDATYYYNSTVLLAPYSPGRARGQITIHGQVNRPGQISVPTNEVMRVSSAIYLAGGFTGQADASKVVLVRPDPNDAKEYVKTTIDVAQMFSQGDFSKDLMVQSGDYLLVPSTNDSAGYIWVTGEVRNPGPIALPLNGSMTASEAIIRAGGFTDWAVKDEVLLVRHDAQGKELPKVYIDVKAVLNQGKTEKDVKLVPTDRLIVSQAWIKF